MPTIFSIELDGIKLRENGKVSKGKKGVNALGANLFYPREGVPSTNAVRTMRLLDDNGLLFNAEPYEKRLLFKETVRDRTVLTIEVTAIEKPSKIDKVVSSLLGVAVSTAAAGISGAILAAVTGSLAGSIFGSINSKDKVTVIARGTRVIKEDFEGGLVKIPLKVPAEVKLIEKKLGPDGIVESEKTLPKGEPNGKVTVRIKRL